MRRLVYALAAVLALAGCGGGSASSTGYTPRPTRIDWLGHQCYRITSSLGTTILTNPYAAKTGGRTLPSPLTADIALITTERPDSNNINAIDNQPAILRGGVGMGLSTITGIPIRGVPSYRNPEVQSSDGMNLAFAWGMDGMRFCFPGRQARPFDAEQLAQIGAVDILFLPMDSLGTAARDEMVAQLQPKLVIPMATTPRGRAVGDSLGVQGDSLSFTRKMLPAQTTTFVFQR